MTRRTFLRFSVVFCLALLGLVTGCGGLQEMWEGPAARGFYPKTMAILPISGTYDSAREDVEEVVAKVLIKWAQSV